MEQHILQPLDTKDGSPAYQIWYKGEKTLIEGEPAKLLKLQLAQAKVDYNDRRQSILQEHINNSHAHQETPCQANS